MIFNCTVYYVNDPDNHRRYKTEIEAENLENAKETLLKSQNVPEIDHYELASDDECVCFIQDGVTSIAKDAFFLRRDLTLGKVLRR